MQHSVNDTQQWFLTKRIDLISYNQFQSRPKAVTEKKLDYIERAHFACQRISSCTLYLHSGLSNSKQPIVAVENTFLDNLKFVYFSVVNNQIFIKCCWFVFGISIPDYPSRIVESNLLRSFLEFSDQQLVRNYSQFLSISLSYHENKIPYRQKPTFQKAFELKHSVHLNISLKHKLPYCEFQTVPIYYCTVYMKLLLPVLLPYIENLQHIYQTPDNLFVCSLLIVSLYR